MRKLPRLYRAGCWGREETKAVAVALLNAFPKQGEPERLGNFPTGTPSGSLNVSPDGSKIMIAARESASGNDSGSSRTLSPLPLK
jgi:hypothetical protein